jgi:LmbE family N-acetylglucosaminyl deacetylase
MFRKPIFSAVLPPIRILLLLAALSTVAAAQSSLSADAQLSRTGGPELAQDRGAAALYQELQKLRTTARLMHIVAHPDDEDGGMLTLETRGHGATVILFTLNRGEGGQNKFGAETADDLGILRTLEQLAADRYYSVEQRFSRVIDFGFSKTAEESFSKWGGHDPALADLVYDIRKFRPDVIISRFSGTKRDGHGNHEASGILAQEAFRAAADPNRFPEQIAAGLLPWQAKKLYSDNVPRRADLSVADDNYTLRLDTGEYSLILGMSYAQFGLEGLAHQTSQGTGGARIPPGHRYTYYKLLQSVLPPLPAGAHEQDYTDGLDTSLSGLAARVSQEAIREKLRQSLSSIAQYADNAARLVSVSDPNACAPALLAGLNETRRLMAWVTSSQLSPAEKSDLLPALRTKEAQFEQAANEALGIALDASVDPAGGPLPTSLFPRMEQTFTLATPGQTFTLTARLHNRGKNPLAKYEVKLELPQGWESAVLKQSPAPLAPGESAFVQFQIRVPADAPYTRPYWSRKDAETENVYTIKQPEWNTWPLPPYPVHVIATYQAFGVIGEARATANVKFIDPATGQAQRPLAVGPALSVLPEQSVAVIPAKPGAQTQLAVTVRSNLQQPIQATLRLEALAGWKVDPASQTVNLDRDGDVNTYSFQVAPGNLHEGTYQLTARAQYNGRDYAEGFRLIGRGDLGAFYSYHPATVVVRAIDLNLPAALRVGYVMGAGDEIPAVLAGMGVNVQQITPQELASGDLGRYDTIVVGIRAYDVRTDVREHNRRLLDFVERGGTLIVQYNQSVGLFNEGRYTPYPATLGSARVSVEEVPVQILAPQDPVLNSPNRIGAKDFDGWVQERGLYFMSQWDSHFQPLLESHDPGESPQQGGILMARYGKGIYIYSGYAFFRQLPAGVPGAVRLFVNLMSAGHSTGTNPQH